MFRLFILSNLISSALFAACPIATDPDEFFDRLGAKCIEYSQDSLSESARAELSSGKLSFSIGTADDVIRSMTVQTDGRMVAVGRTATGTTNQFLAVRFEIDGSFDLTFNTTGLVVLSLSTQDAIGHRVIVQSNGSIAVGGRIQSNKLGFLAVRYTSSGALDTSFGTRGYVDIPIGASTSVARGLSIDTLGRYYLAGYSWTTSRYIAAVARLKTDGTLDTTFATIGKLTLDFLTAAVGILGTEMDSQGRLVFGGTGQLANWLMVAGRFNSDGTLDTSFQTKGWVTFSFGTGANQFYDVKMSGDKIVFVGSYYGNPNMDTAILRLNTDGTLDTTFATTGRLTRSFSTGDDFYYTVQVTGTNGLVVSGYGTLAKQNFLTARYTSNGSLDTSYTTTGFQFTSVSTSDQQAIATYVSSSGQIYPAGRVIKSATDSDVGLARLSYTGNIAMSGSFDESFGTNGFTQLEVPGTWSTEQPYGLAFDAFGRMNIVGYSYPFGQMLLRVMPNGTLDTSFNSDGIADGSCSGCSPTWMDVDPLGRPLIYSGDSGGTAYNFRFNTNGTLDTSFSTVGWKAASQGYSYHGFLMSDGRFVTGTQIVFSDSYVSRFTSNGSFDTSWGGSGRVQFASAQGAIRVVAPDDQGRVLATGDGCVGSGCPFVARWNSNGTLDTSFATNGRIAITVGGTAFGGGLAVGADGNVWMAAMYNSSGMNHNTRVFRFRSNGSLDTAFSTIGYFDTGVTATTRRYAYLVLQNNNKAVVDSGRFGYASYFRLNSNGTYDTSFATSGTLAIALTTYESYKIRMSNTGRVCGAGQTITNYAMTCFWP